MNNLKIIWLFCAILWCCLFSISLIFNSTIIYLHVSFVIYLYTVFLVVTILALCLLLLLLSSVTGLNISTVWRANILIYFPRHTVMAMHGVHKRGFICTFWIIVFILWMVTRITLTFRSYSNIVQLGECSFPIVYILLPLPITTLLLCKFVI